MKPAQLSVSAQKVLDEEEISSARQINKIRYFFALFLFGPVLIMSVQAGVFWGIVANMSGLSLYFLATLYHSKILRTGNIKKIRKYNYVTVIADFTTVMISLLFWGLHEMPENLAFTLKNPIWLYMSLGMIVTAFQFQVRITMTSLSLVLVLYLTLFIIMLFQQPEFTNDWKAYIMGPKIVGPDIVFTKPLIFSFIAISVAATIRKSISMVQKIGIAEARRMTLSRYFSPAVVADITEHPEEMKKAKRQKVSILFTDIRNFTKLSECLDAETLVEWLSDFRSRMTKIIFDHSGTVDKFIGDAILATFGTPHPSELPETDARNAVKCGLDMQNALLILNSDWKDRGIEIEIGIGIHTGEVLAGNIGNAEHAEYTVIGDAVNTASRIESLCKKMERNFIISEEVYNELDGTQNIEKLPRVLVKGKSEPLSVYAVKNL